MIVFVANRQDDAITQAVERSKSGRWHGVFKLPHGLFEVHNDVYPSVTGIVKVAMATNGTLRVCA